jgi:hypothetical protein
MQSIAYDISGIGASLITRTWMLQRAFNWQLLMSANINNTIGYLVSQYCQDVRFGDYSITEVESLRYGAQQRFYAGLQSIELVSATFIVPVDNSVLSYFSGWSDLIVDKNGYYYPKNNYKKDIYVMLYDRTGIESVKFRLKGAFPKTRPILELSYENENVLRYKIDFCIDCIETTSLLGSIREKVTEKIGNIFKPTPVTPASPMLASTNTTPGFGTTPTPTGNFYA